MVGMVVDVKLIFVMVLKVCVVVIILVYNYLSVNLMFFVVDKVFIVKLVVVGKVFDLLLFDYLILLFEGGYFSFVDEGLI